MRGRVLIVAGSDSGGGAGIQADIKTVTALGGYAATAITALTAQNTTGVFGIHDVPAQFVAQQMRLVLEDIGADAIKIGMLHRPETIDAVADVLANAGRGIPVVLDPVMMAKGGDALLTPEAMFALRDRLVSNADVLTPNLPEAEALASMSGEVAGEGEVLARQLVALGPRAVLLKGGHGLGAEITDLLVQSDQPVRAFRDTRLDTPHTHGTGCTLASAIATGIAQSMDVPAAVVRGRAYLREAIRTAPGLGRGHGPVNHGHTVRRFTG